MNVPFLAGFAWLASSFFVVAEAAQCASDVRSIEVATSIDLEKFITSLECNVTRGTFNVTWHGRRQIPERIEVSGMKNVTITGVGLNDTPPAAANNAGIETSMFIVHGGSTLSFRNLAFDGGFSQQGAAIFVRDKSVVNVFDCAFTNNTADVGGAIYAEESTVNIDGITIFTNNSASHDGGVIYAEESTVKIDGITRFTNNSASHDGGVIAFLPGGILHVAGSSTFTNNIASGDGGAITAEGGVLDIDGTACFTGNSAGGSGGAIRVSSSQNVSIYGDNTIFANNIAVAGGAIYAIQSEVNIGGDTSCFNNSATSHETPDTGGGVIYAEASIVNIEGITSFISNSAVIDGGAILLVDKSEVYITGSTEFIGNQAGDDGGAISTQTALAGGIIHVAGSSTFTNNTASDDGGAIRADDAFVQINGTAYFAGNSAGDSGGAIRVARGQELSIFGHATVFTGNSAVVGGAIHTGSCSLGIRGHVTFADNSAVEFGGAAFSVEDDPVKLEGQLSFLGNRAGPGGGGVSIGDPGEMSMTGATFSRNKANVGGAVSLNAAKPNDREIKECIFEYNTADADGGAMYFFSTGGSDIVNSSLFRGNYAANSGGAIFDKETLTLVSTTFWENTAGDKSFALQGSAAVTLNNVSFVNNTFHCAFGDYLYEDTLREDDSSDDTRFKLECAECSTAGSGSNHYRVQVKYRNRIPTCEEVPTGVEALSSGTTVEHLTLKAGYFRITDKSRDIRECHRHRSCLGGNDTNNYCATGYVGPYCAACAEGFAPWTGFECRQCSDAGRPSSVGLSVTIAIIVVAGAAALSAYLMRAIHSGDGQDETEITRGSMERRCIHLENVFVKIFPLTTVKIVVVVWQIISQFATVAGDVYPEEYATFISSLSFINLDIGVILSYSCLVSTDFYDHLLLNTIAPLVVMMALSATYSVAQRRNQGSEDAMRKVQHKHLSAGLFVAFFMYSSVSFTIFQTFVCETLDDGVSYLRADYNLTCDTDRYAIYRAYAIVMMCVYPIGLPAILLWWLIRNRVALKKDNRTTIEHLEPFSGIWSQYRPSRYYYEVIEFGRRIALTATASFVSPNSVAQVAVVLLVAAVLFLVSESMSPFSSSVNMSLYRWGNGIILASMYVALLMQVDTSSEESSALSAFGMVLIAANVFLVVTVLVHPMVMAFEWQGVTRSARLVPTTISGGCRNSITATTVRTTDFCYD